VLVVTDAHSRRSSARAKGLVEVPGGGVKAGRCSDGGKHLARARRLAGVGVHGDLVDGVRTAGAISREGFEERRGVHLFATLVPGKTPGGTDLFGQSDMGRVVGDAVLVNLPRIELCVAGRVSSVIAPTGVDGNERVHVLVDIVDLIADHITVRHQLRVVLAKRVRVVHGDVHRFAGRGELHRAATRGDRVVVRPGALRREHIGRAHRVKLDPVPVGDCA